MDRVRSLVMLLVAQIACTQSVKVVLEDQDGDSDGSDSGVTTEDCAEELIPALQWFEEESVAVLESEIEFAQTHVIGSEETRWAPSIIEGRATMVLITPNDVLSSAADVRIAAWQEGALLGVLSVAPPEELPPSLEQGLTSVELEKWSEDAWSVFVPWNWIREGVVLQIGTLISNELWTYEHTLMDLGAPHTFTISRAKMVLFGDSDKSTSTSSAEKIAQDYYASYPVARMNWVDAAPWRLDQIVVNSEGGPVLVNSEDERLDLTTDPDRWGIIKHQFALRMNLANTGRGLFYVLPAEGDNSPYSFGTSIGSGWVRNGDGSYSDLDNAPYAAGWTGWTAMWLGECGNTFIHEVGHSATLAHFTSGTGVSWGIADQYPLDGINLEVHPWGFDSTRQLFRTWYRVDGNGIVQDDNGGIQGKRDPMNGGEGGNAITCFPQYTGYHAWKIQNWTQTTPTITSVDEQAGAYLWDSSSRSYVETDMGVGNAIPTATGGPVATIVGTLGNSLEAAHIYPPIYWSSGNLFELPDPNQSEDLESYAGSHHFLDIEYADGSREYALINKGEIEDSGLYLFSVNVALERNPVQVSLMYSETAYPELETTVATGLYTRGISEPIEKLPSVVVVGEGFIANGSLELQDLCEAGINCDSRQKESIWRWNTGSLHFVLPDSDVADTASCTERDGITTFSIPIVNDAGEQNTLTVYGQRIVSASSDNWSGAINDVTLWIDAPNVSQGLRVWAPMEENRDLAAGIWRNDGNFDIAVAEAGEIISETPINVVIEIQDTELINLNTPYEGPHLTAEGSSLYFLLTDPSIGPTSRVWWGDSNPNLLSIPVINEDSGELTTLYVNAWKRSCDLGWGTWWNLNAGQSADSSCEQWAYLAIAETGNEHLSSGQRYVSPQSHPVILEARRWHDPNATSIVENFAYQIEYIAP